MRPFTSLLLNAKVIYYLKYSLFYKESALNLIIISYFVAQIQVLAIERP